MNLDEAMPDLDWIDKRPGTKLIIRGNHDYWCSAPTKVRKALPSSIHLIWSDAYLWNDVAVCGTRLWDSPEYDFSPYIVMKQPIKEGAKEKPVEETEHVFTRELMRLESSIKAMNKGARLKIAMVHYPPIGADLAPSRASRMLEDAGISICTFGHLHSVKQGSHLFGTKNGIAYHFVACDWLGFKLLKIA
jgi:predicted phosphohydrolase